MPATPTKKLLSCEEKNRRKRTKKSKNKTFAMGYVYKSRYLLIKLQQ